MKDDPTHVAWPDAGSVGTRSACSGGPAHVPGRTGCFRFREKARIREGDPVRSDWVNSSNTPRRETASLPLMPLAISWLPPCPTG
jgi:hypothetical protein